jgi:PUB domain.
MVSSKKNTTAPTALKILVKCGWSGARIPIPSTITKASTLAEVIGSIEFSLPPVITKPLGSWDEPQPSIVYLRTNVLKRDWQVTKVSDFCDGGSILLTLNLPSNNGNEMCGEIAVPAHTTRSVEPMDIDDSAVFDHVETNNDVSSSASVPPKEAMRLILKSNFDKDSQECLQTILKIVDNLLSKNDAKFRSLRINNKAFEKKILSKRGGLELLFSLGFEYDVVNNIGFDFDNSKNTQKSSDSIILRPENEDRELLMDARGELSEILMTTLKTEGVPSMPNIAPLPNPASDGRVHVATFDPFKSQSFNTQAAAAGAPNPSSVAPDGGKSSTERKLEMLQQKQKRLEESIQKLTDREISAFLPGEIGPIVSLNSPGDSIFDGKGDAALLASAAKKKMEERKKQEEGGFTTKSMREFFLFDSFISFVWMRKLTNYLY